jgi:enterochelin esterase-like enzyme
MLYAPGRRIWVVFLALTLGACTGEERRPGTTGGAGAPATGAAGTGSGAGTTGTTGTAGVGTAGTGAAGTNPTGAAGSGAAGMAASGTAGAGAAGAGTGVAGSGASGASGAAGATGGTGAGSLTMGSQADPGTMGDGTFPLPPPYNLPPESMGPINNAPKGTVTGPFLHTQTGTYTGWNMWKWTYYVYVPSQYQKGHAAALMIFNDGYLYAGINTLTDARFNAPQVFDNLIKAGEMPVTIAVFIFPGTNDGHQVGGGDNDRSTQYDTANDQYGKFLRTEFLPTEILNKYDIVTDADGWAMAGHSSGGIASIIAGWFHADRWHKMLTASPSFPNKGGMFPNLFKTAPAKPLRIYHMAGTMDLGGFRGANDSAAMILQMLGYHDRYRQTQDVHYPPHAAMADFAEALRWLWRGYSAGL